VLALGRSGTHGAANGALPVLADGVLAATLQALSWKEAATVEVGMRSWVSTKRGGELTGRFLLRLELVTMRRSAAAAAA
jgi:hypothetical protein